TSHAASSNSVMSKPPRRRSVTDRDIAPSPPDEKPSNRSRSSCSIEYAATRTKNREPLSLGFSALGCSISCRRDIWPAFSTDSADNADCVNYPELKHLGLSLAQPL